MLAERHLLHSVRDGGIVPRFLTEADHPWLRALIEEHERFAGRPERALAQRLAEGLPVPCPAEKLLLAAHVLRRICGRVRRFPVDPRRVRALVFGAASRGVDAPLGEAAHALALAPAEAERLLFADLEGERAVTFPARWPGAPELALRVNLALAQGFLSRAHRVEIRLLGNARAVVRQARLRGLLVTAREGRLEISGPLALFRRTILYGRALAGIVPHLAWCDRFVLRADCVVRRERLQLRLQSGDPIFPADEPRRFDSALEERFAREFRAAAPDWDLVREPEPVPAEGTLVFPDFALLHRADPTHRWLLEIAGFWTPAYVREKLERLRAARLQDFILCLDAGRDCGEGTLPEGARIVRYRRRIDPGAILSIIARQTRCVE